MYRAIRIAALMLLLGLSEAAAARNYTVEDLLRTEGFGAALFDPQDRWLVFERLEPFLEMSRFDMLPRADVLRSRLYRVDLDVPWRAIPLLPDEKPGIITYGFSTDGSRLAVGRLADNRWQLGVVTMASGAVRWFDLSPDYSPFYTSLQWIGTDKLVAVVDPKGERPWWLRSDSVAADTLPQRWAATRSGAAVAVTVVGSGRFLGSGAEPPENQFVLFDAASGEIATLATGRFLSIDVAPTSKHVALIERGTIAPLPQDRAMSQVDLPYRQIPLIYDLEHGRLWRACADCEMLGKPIWSPDGRRLALLARMPGRDWPDAELVEADVRRKSVKSFRSAGIKPVITESPDGTARAAFHWSGSDLLLFGQSAADAKRRAEWYRLRADTADPLSSKLTAAVPHLATMAGCDAAMVAPDAIWCLDGATPKRLFDAGTRISSGKALGWKKVVRGVAIVGKTPQRELRLGAKETVEGVVASPTGRKFLVRARQDDGVSALVLASSDRAQTIAGANRHLRDVEAARARPLIYRLADGQQVTSWMYLPPHVPEGTRPALVVIPYPGAVYGETAPAGQDIAAARFYTNAQLLAARGYAVLLPSLPSKPLQPGRPPSFVDDVGRAVDAAVATGTVDPLRIGLWGHSYGAYATAMIVAHDCRYSTAVASAGIYDLAAITGIFGSSTRLAPERGLPVGQLFAWAETGQGGLGVPPWRDPERYVAASPAYLADRIATPMLIIAADQDPSPLPQSEQLFSALFRQGKDAELITYWGEGHVVGSPANVRDLYGRISGWLDKTLTPRRMGDCVRADGHIRRAPSQTPR